MKWNSHFFLGLTLLFAPFHNTSANVKSQVKLASKPVLSAAAKAIIHGKSKTKPEPAPVIPYEYKVYEHAKKDSLLPKLSLSTIETHQKELKHLQWNTINKSLEKEAEDLYWFYEVSRAEKLGGVLALNSWIKSLNSLNQFKWIYAWTPSTSKALLKICKSKKKSGIEEKCTYLSKKVSDAFPKLAVETQELKVLLPESTALENSGDKYDRLSQTYGEKTEKDEQAFAEVLDNYLNHRDEDLYKTAKSFIESFPKSMLRFRAMFLMAERQFAHGDKKEAEINYSLILNQVPYSYYAIVAGERLGVQLKERLLKEPLKVSSDPADFKLNFLEKESLYRLKNLVRGKHYEGVGIELEQFTRIRNYSTEFLIYLIQQANQADQNLAGFRFASEILQRKNEAPLNVEFLELIFPDRFPKEIANQAKISQIDPLLVVSLMKQESGFKGGILSSSGAAGLMQLMPFTAIEVQKDLELQKLREPVKNIEIGTRYLASLLNEKFNGNVVYALAGYNAGPHRVAKWRKDAHSDWGMQEFVEAIPFKETRDYVMSILRNRYWYQYLKGSAQQSVFEAWRSP
jgi:soluble lytic murein transglycosylase-like protein